MKKRGAFINRYLPEASQFEVDGPRAYRRGPKFLPSGLSFDRAVAMGESPPAPLDACDTTDSHSD